MTQHIPTPRPRTARPRTALAATAALGGGLLLALAAPLSASAHVGVEPTSTAEGSYTVVAFAIPHGCGDSPTTKLTFTMPEGVDRVTPTVNSGWTIEKVVEELPEPKTDSHGANLVDRDAQVVYTAVTPLPSDLRDVIELSFQLPADAAGETLAFPVLQECAEGSTDWSELAEEGEEEPEHPAPSIVVTAAEAGGHGHGGASDEAMDDPADASGASDATAATGDDPVARWLAVGGLAVGVAGVVLAVLARRRPARG
ncbi:YcnI family protein [Agromyces sp. G08B096]|uniref:YcnI family protein n=1 Tax=Agromyces sp. G08B096 TaxID=3156399 RepID=A0AAU7W6H1_9MICO